ncbi:MAG: glycosyltransferase [Myxococcaceae bacterium]|nr:glycosyltransferase [Myxococcaceae bacterium]
MSDLPRLLFCCFDVVPAPHATSRRLTEYLKGLSERYQVVVLSVKTPDHSHIERYQGARLLRVPVGSGDLRSRMEAYDRAVRRQLESEEYVLVHFFDPVSGYPLCERRGEFGFKLVYDATRFPSGDLPSLQPQEGSNKRLLARSRRQELFCLMNADAVIVGSEAAREHVVSLGVPRANVNVVRAPVDLAPYSPELMGQPDGSPARLIHLGSHGKHQDLALLFEALTKTKEPLKLALVGPSSPELTPSLKARAGELGLAERVEFQEPVSHDDVHKVMAAADIGVLTLADEPRNRSTTALARLGEYLAAGRPLLAADTPLSRELCPAPATRFYPPGDLAGLVSALDELAAPEVRKALGAAARAATEPIDANTIRDTLVARYARVAPGAAAPSDAPADEVDPSEATQLGGRPPDETGDVTQAGARIPVPDSGPHDLGTNKVKTDPAVRAPSPEADTGTDQAAARDRPPVMGTLLRDDRPPVAPEATDPNVSASRELPVVLGLPLTDRLPDADAVDAPAPREGPPVPDEVPLSARTQPSLPVVGEFRDEVRTAPGRTLPLDAMPLQPAEAKARAATASEPTVPRASALEATPTSSTSSRGEPTTRSPALTIEATPAPSPASRADPTSRSPALTVEATPAPSAASRADPTSRSPGLAIEAAPGESTSPRTPGFTIEPPPVGVAALRSATVGAEPAPAASPRPVPTAPDVSAPPSVVRPPPIGAADDEPLDFSNLLKPSAPVRPGTTVVTLPSPNITAPIPPPAPSARPAPIPVPTSFGAPPRPTAPPPGMAVVAVPVTFPATSLPPPLKPATAAGLPASSASGLRAAPSSSPSSASAVPLSTSPSVVRAGGAPPPLPTSPSGVRPPSPFDGVPTPVSSTAPRPAGSPFDGVPSKPAAAPEGLPPLSRLVPNPTAGGAPVLARQPADAEPVEEVHDEEFELVNDESFQSLHDGDDDDELHESELEALDTSAAPPPSRLDPWFAQLVHGYCPPESQLFTRHVPPTTMPGKNT